MGGGGSQTIEQTFNLKALNKSIFNQITTNQQSLSAANSNIQKVDVNVGNIGPKCNLKIGQKIDAKTVSSAVMSPKTIAETKDTVQNELQASAEAALEKTTEAGNFQFDDKQNLKQKITQEVINVVDKTFETNNLNEISSELFNSQEGRLNIKNCNGKVDLSQDIVADQLAQAITDSLTTAISDNDVLSQLTADASGKLKSENKGLADIISKIFAGLTGPILYIAIACVICVCVVMLGGTLFMLSPGGQKVANAGASRMKGH